MILVDHGLTCGNGVFGSVEKLPSGRYRARVWGPEGRYVSAPQTFTTKSDANVWVDLQRADMVRQVWRAPNRDTRSVADYVNGWIDQHSTAKLSTRQLYRGLLVRCIEPDLGRVPLSKLTPAQVRSWHHQLGKRFAADAAKAAAAQQARASSRPGSAKAGPREFGPVRDGRTRQAQAYRLLRAAMTTANLDGLIAEQPCRVAGAGTPRRSLDDVRPDLAERLLSPAQVAAVAAAMPVRYRALVLAAAWSGLRQGELLGLTRADLELEASPPVLHVRRPVYRIDDGSIDVDLPKTPASRRTVALPGPLAEILKAHLQEFATGPDGTPRAGYVFTTARGTVPARSNLNATLRTAMRKAEVEPVKFHDLRHVAQVLAAESGATLTELMARMGHTTPAAAQVYMHAARQRDALVAEALGQAMTSAPAVIALRRRGR